jgi:hypothetical protein
MTCEMGHDLLEAESHRAVAASYKRHQLSARLPAGGNDTQRLL